MSMKWEPWLMKDGKRSVRLFTGREFHSLGEVQDWLGSLPIINPKLSKAHIEFEEVPDRPRDRGIDRSGRA